MERRIQDVKLLFLSNIWTDHCLLTMDLEILKSATTGPGTWRMNSLLTDSESLQTLLHESLDQLSQEFAGNQTMDKKTQWDTIKHAMYLLAAQSSESLRRTTQRRMIEAQNGRHALLSQMRSTQQHSVDLEPELKEVERQISEELVQQTKALSIRSATRWY